MIIDKIEEKNRVSFGKAIEAYPEADYIGIVDARLEKNGDSTGIVLVYGNEEEVETAIKPYAGKTCTSVIQGIRLLMMERVGGIAYDIHQ
jgi:hypothetical protein